MKRKNFILLIIIIIIILLSCLYINNNKTIEKLSNNNDITSFNLFYPPSYDSPECNKEKKIPRIDYEQYILTADISELTSLLNSFEFLMKLLNLLFSCQKYERLILQLLYQYNLSPSLLVYNYGKGIIILHRLMHTIKYEETLKNLYGPKLLIVSFIYIYYNYLLYTHNYKDDEIYNSHIKDMVIKYKNLYDSLYISLCDNYHNNPIEDKIYRMFEIGKYIKNFCNKPLHHHHDDPIIDIDTSLPFHNEHISNLESSYGKLIKHNLIQPININVSYNNGNNDNNSNDNNKPNLSNHLFDNSLSDKKLLNQIESDINKYDMKQEYDNVTNELNALKHQIKLDEYNNEEQHKLKNIINNRDNNGWEHGWSYVDSNNWSKHQNQPPIYINSPDSNNNEPCPIINKNYTDYLPKDLKLNEFKTNDDKCKSW